MTEIRCFKFQNRVSFADCAFDLNKNPEYKKYPEVFFNPQVINYLRVFFRF